MTLPALGGVHVTLGLLQAGEDLFEQSLVLRRVLAEPFVHLLHLPADPLQGLRGGGSLGGCRRGGDGRRRGRPRGDHAVLLNGGVSGDGPRGLHPRVAQALLVTPALPQQLLVLLQQGVVLLIHLPQDGHATFAHAVCVEGIATLTPA